jgi:hypothetical protein
MTSLNALGNRRTQHDCFLSKHSFVLMMPMQVEKAANVGFGTRQHEKGLLAQLKLLDALA